MLKQLKLTNYRQHIDRTVEFKPGINAIRGHNEAGKTTIMEAWAYLFFGTKALSEALDDVVTYDTPVSKLKVEGDFTYLGVDYSAYRGKSGAEVRFGKEIITGQTEVTKFFESLFKCSAAMAGRLMIAEQVQLRGALEEGPKAAGEMIQYLADFDLLERIIDLVQEQLPVGVTTGVESRIALLVSQAKDVEVTDIAPLETAVAGATDTLNTSRAALGKLVDDLDQLDVVQASQILADEARLTAVVATQATKIATLETLLAEPLPAAPAEGVIDAVRAKIEAQKNLAAAARVHAELKACTVDVLWDEPREALDTEISAARGRLAVLITEARAAEDKLNNRRITGQGRTRDLEQAIALAQAKLIKDNSCAFCQKDLTDVPEVVKVNSDLSKEIASLERQLADQKAALTADLENLQGALTATNKRLDEVGEECRELDEVAKVDDRWNTVLAKAGDYVTVDRGVVPARWTWTGPTDEAQDFAGELAALVEQEQDAVSARATWSARSLQCEDLKTDHQANVAALAALPIKDAKETIELADALKPKIAAARDLVEVSADAVNLAQGTLATAKLANEQGAKAAKAAKEQLELAQAELDAMVANNILVNKVRKARPVITSKLWNLTLGAVSKYFTDVRAIPSVITRDTDSFKCNGKPVKGLSGSAKDSLGLAIRVALVKTFLPTMPFMMLDEPAAACSDERETSMLGMLSTIGFDQVILVTHSSLADAFSDHLIQL